MDNKEAIAISDEAETQTEVPEVPWYLKIFDIKRALQADRDYISRQAVLNEVMAKIEYLYDSEDIKDHVRETIEQMPSVAIPSQRRTGEWLRMSDLSEEEDDRYKCSRCGNVVHHSNRVNLFTFNRWCGRCGSRNDGEDD